MEMSRRGGFQLWSPSGFDSSFLFPPPWRCVVYSRRPFSTCPMWSLFIRPSLGSCSPCHNLCAHTFLAVSISRLHNFLQTFLCLLHRTTWPLTPQRIWSPSGSSIVLSRCSPSQPAPLLWPQGLHSTRFSLSCWFISTVHKGHGEERLPFLNIKRIKLPAGPSGDP